MELLPDLDGQESERLTYRKLSPADIDAWMEFHRSEEAIRFFGYSLNDRAICEQMFGKQLWRYAHNNSGLRAVVLKDGGELIGMCGLLTQKLADVEEWEIAYRFLPRFWGKGYCTEAAVELRNRTFAESSRESLISMIDPDNLRSAGVAKRNGMNNTGPVDWHGKEANIWRVYRKDLALQPRDE